MTVALTALLGAGVAGCGSGEPTPRGTVTVRASSPGTTTTTADEPEGGDVKGRLHDAGTIQGVEGVDGQLVLTLDRWTVTGIDDPALAQSGAPIAPYTGERFANQNADRTYTVPVAEDAVLVINECEPPATAGGTPGLTSRRGDLEEFLKQPTLQDQVVLLTYSADGELVQLDTDPRCG